MKTLETIHCIVNFMEENRNSMLYIALVCAGLGGGSLIYQANRRDAEIGKVKDYNNDGIEDIMIDMKNDGETKERYLFLGQKDGKYVKLKECGSEEIKYFMGDDNTKFIWNGSEYQKLPGELK